LSWEYAHAKRRPCEIVSGQRFFFRPDGTKVWRTTNPHVDPNALRRIDLDAMGRKQLYAFLASWGPKESLMTWGRRLFPLRPIHYPRAARMLYQMARLKLIGRISRYEAMYLKLPPYAQFRQQFNPLACRDDANKT
jgi:hypothetical protein